MSSEVDKTLHLDGRRLAYVTWFLSADKDPKTRKAWAETNDTSRMTLWEWERSDWFAKAIEEDAGATKARWALLYSELEWVALQREDLSAKVAALDKIAKIYGKYAPTKIDMDASGPFLDLQKKLVDIRRQSIDAVN